MTYFYNLCSSSKGNSTYIGNENEGIIFDLGIGIRCFEKSLKTASINPDAVKAVFITHEHYDHIKGLDAITKKYNIPVFASCGTSESLSLSWGEVHIINEAITVSGFEVTPFHTSHDVKESLGFTVKTPDGRKIAICTDLGYVSDEVMDALLGNDFVMLESNYDENMLMYGDYPFFLKKRIASRRGHLSNMQCAETLKRLIENGTNRFALAHLSENNNRPETALAHSKNYLAENDLIEGRDYFIEVLKTVNDGKVIEI